jgi:hypothetical protein
MRRRHIGIGLVIVVVAAAVVFGLILIGSPTEERLRRLDSRRVSDLKLVSQGIDAYWTQNKRLPDSLDELLQQPLPKLNLSDKRFRDPMTGQLYEYHTVGEKSYELYATFQRDSARDFQEQNREFWSHGTGRHCFELEAHDVK